MSNYYKLFCTGVWYFLLLVSFLLFISFFCSSIIQNSTWTESPVRLSHQQNKKPFSIVYEKYVIHNSFSYLFLLVFNFLFSTILFLAIPLHITHTHTQYFFLWISMTWVCLAKNTNVLLSVEKGRKTLLWSSS